MPLAVVDPRGFESALLGASQVEALYVDGCSKLVETVSIFVITIFHGNR